MEIPAALVRLRRRPHSPLSLLVAVDVPDPNAPSWPGVQEQHSELIVHVYACEAEALAIERMDKRLARWEYEGRRQRI